MGFFETFYIQKIDKEGKRFFRERTLDSEEVESWEKVDGEYTKVFMKSGDSFILRIDFSYFTDIIYADEDAYGKLLVINKN